MGPTAAPVSVELVTFPVLLPPGNAVPATSPEVGSLQFVPIAIGVEFWIVSVPVTVETATL